MRPELQPSKRWGEEEVHLLFFFFLQVFRIELRALQELGEHTIELYLQPTEL